MGGGDCAVVGVTLKWLTPFISADIDECEDAAREGMVLCVDNSKCINTRGSYNCTCFDGYNKINGSCERKWYFSDTHYFHCIIINIKIIVQEVPVEITPAVALPAEILANGIRITINNYNKENVCNIAHT